MSESTSQLKIGAALDGSFEQTTTTVKRKLNELGGAANSTGKSLAGMGDGTAKSAQKVEQATKSMVSSIQRTTALMDAGAKGSAEYYKALANQRGIDVNVLKPYLDQLDAVKIKQAQATSAMLSGGKSLDKIGMSAAATANALRGVPAQFTDIVTSIQGGQKPLTVFLQQGGQLKDMFGGAGNAAKALGGYVLGLINPFTIAVGAVAGLAIAYESGAAESRALNTALILSGNQAGTTTGQMMAMAASIDRVSGTQGGAAEALAIFATSGKVASENLEQFTLTAIRFEKVTGTSIEETAKKFADLKKAPLEATLKLNESMGYLTQGIYDQIKALTEQGRATEAASLAQSEFDKATAQMATDIERNLGVVQRSWNGVTGAVKEAWDAIKGIGRDAGLEGQVAAAQKMVDIRRQAANSIYGNASDFAKLSQAENKLAGYQELLKNQQVSAKYAAERTESVKQGAEWDKLGVKYLTDSVKMEREIAAAKVLGIAAGKTAVELAQREAEIRKSYDKKTPVAKQISIAGQSEVASIRARIIIGEDYLRALKTEGIATKEKNEGEKLAIKIQKELEGGLKGVALANKEKALSAAQSLAAVLKESDALKELLTAQSAFEKLRDKEIAGQEATIVKMEEKAMAMEDEVRMYGLGKEAIEALSIARLQERIDILGGFDNSAEQISLIEKEIAARKRLAVATDAKSGKVAAEKYAGELLKANQKAAEESGKYWEDALMRAFESGKGFFQSLWDTIKNTLKTQVLKVVIQGTMGSLGIGAAGAASAGGGGITGFAGTASTISNLYAGVSSLIGIGNQVIAGTMSAANALGTIAANASGTGITGLLATNGAYGTAAAGTGGVMGSISSALGSIPGWGWAAIGAAAVLGLRSSPISTQSTGYASRQYGSDGMLLSSATDGSGIGEAGRVLDGIYKSIAGVQASLGATGGASITYNSNTGRESKDPQFYLKTGSYDSGEIQKNDANVALAISRTILTAIQDSDLPKYLQGAFDGMVAGSMSQEQITAAITGGQALKAFNDQLLSLPFANIADLSFAATQSLIGFSGGLDQLKGNLASYYDNFYSTEEKTAQLTLNTSKAFESLGLVMPALDEGARAAYRSMVELAGGQDLSVEANAKAYAGLLALNPAINQLAQSAVDAVAKINAAVQSAQNVAVQIGITTAYAAAQASAQAAYDAAIKAAPGLSRYTERQIVAYASDPTKRNELDANTFAVIDTLVTAIGAWDAAKSTEAQRIASGGASPDSSTADTNIADAIAQITKGLTDAGASLGVELLKAQGKTVEALAAQRAIDIAGYNAAQIALYDYNQGIRDQITALNEASALQARIASERTGLQDQYDQLTMTSAELLAKQRAGLDASNQALFDSINLIKAETTAKEAALTAAKTGASDAYSGLQRAVDAQRKIVQVARDTAAESVSEITSVFDILSSSVKELYGTVDSTAQMQADQGRAFISNALATAQSTGYLPESKALSDAISAAKGGTKEFASQFEKDFAALTLAGDLSQMELLSKGQLTAAELALKVQDDQLTALDGVLDLAKQQLDAANGINTSVLSVADALTAFNASLLALVNSTRPGGNTAPINTGNEGKAYVNGAGALIANSVDRHLQDFYKASFGREIDMAGLAYWAAQGTTASGNVGDASALELAILKGAGSGETLSASAIDLLRRSGVPGFAGGGMHSGGLRWVGEDGPELEATGPSRIWNAQQLNGAIGGGNTGRLEQLVEGLTKEVQRLQTELVAIKTNTSQMAEHIDEVTEGGNAMRSRAVGVTA
jgi:phage-related minor tail protein